VGPFRICARCLGTYPVLATFLAAQFSARAALAWPWDGAWAIGLLLPALVDWAIGQFKKDWGTNLLRTGTGVSLGLALGRTLYVHVQHPFPAWLLAQMALVTGVAVPVILTRRKRKG
jgi:uncharacterized membrane protein